MQSFWAFTADKRQGVSRTLSGWACAVFRAARSLPAHRQGTEHQLRCIAPRREWPDRVARSWDTRPDWVGDLVGRNAIPSHLKKEARRRITHGRVGFDVRPWTRKSPARWRRFRSADQRSLLVYSVHFVVKNLADILAATHGSGDSNVSFARRSGCPRHPGPIATASRDTRGARSSGKR